MPLASPLISTPMAVQPLNLATSPGFLSFNWRTNVFATGLPLVTYLNQLPEEWQDELGPLFARLDRFTREDHAKVPAFARLISSDPPSSFTTGGHVANENSEAARVLFSYGLVDLLCWSLIEPPPPPHPRSNFAGGYLVSVMLDRKNMRQGWTTWIGGFTHNIRTYIAEAEKSLTDLLTGDVSRPQDLIRDTDLTAATLLGMFDAQLTESERYNRIQNLTGVALFLSLITTQDTLIIPDLKTKQASLFGLKNAKELPRDLMYAGSCPTMVMVALAPVLLLGPKAVTVPQRFMDLLKMWNAHDVASSPLLDRLNRAVVRAIAETGILRRPFQSTLGKLWPTLRHILADYPDKGDLEIAHMPIYPLVLPEGIDEISSNEILQPLVTQNPLTPPPTTQIPLIGPSSDRDTAQSGASSLRMLADHIDAGHTLTPPEVPEAVINDPNGQSGSIAVTGGSSEGGTLSSVAGMFVDTTVQPQQEVPQSAMETDLAMPPLPILPPNSVEAALNTAFQSQLTPPPPYNAPSVAIEGKKVSRLTQQAQLVVDEQQFVRRSTRKRQPPAKFEQLTIQPTHLTQARSLKRKRADSSPPPSIDNNGMDQDDLYYRDDFKWRPNVVDLDIVIDSDAALRCDEEVRLYDICGNAVVWQIQAHTTEQLSWIKCVIDHCPDDPKLCHPDTMSPATSTPTFDDRLLEMISGGNLMKAFPICDFSYPDATNEDAISPAPLTALTKAAADVNGKILHCLDIPNYDSPCRNGPNPLASNWVAWLATTEIPFQEKSFPHSEMEWYIAGLPGSHCDFHLDTNGFATRLCAITGRMLILIAKPREQIEQPLTLEYWPAWLHCWGDETVDFDQFDIYPVLLEPGMQLIMRPGTLHAAITIDPCVISGDHFYHTPSLCDSIWAYYHTFVKSETLTNADHSQAAIFSFHKLLALNYLKYIRINSSSSTHIHDSDWQTGHTLDLSREDHIWALIDLCVLIELGAAVYLPSYSRSHPSFNQTTCDNIMAAHGLAHTVLTWLNLNAYSTDNPGLSIYKDVYLQELSHTISNIQNYITERDIDYAKNKSQVTPYVSLNVFNEKLEKVTDSVKGYDNAYMTYLKCLDTPGNGLVEGFSLFGYKFSGLSLRPEKDWVQRDEWISGWSALEHFKGALSIIHPSELESELEDDGVEDADGEEDMHEADEFEQSIDTSDTENNDNNQPSVDVLAEHRIRNRANHPPNDIALKIAAQMQRSLGQVDNTFVDTIANESSQESTSSDDDESSDVQAKTRAPRNSKKDSSKGPHPATLAYYSGKPEFYPLDYAKKLFHRHVALTKPWPSKCTASDVHEAQLCVKEAFEHYQAEGSAVDPSNVNRNMVNLVFSDAATYQGNLKTKARTMVERKYPDFVNELHDTGQESQVKNWDMLEEENREFLSSGQWHSAGVYDDGTGRRGNLNHPAIARLCIEFYYNPKFSPSALAQLFPNDFKHEVPERAVALVATAVYNALKEYESGQFFEHPFTKLSYEQHYESIWNLITRIKTSPYHEEKWTMCRREWAQAGMVYLRKDSESNPRARQVVCHGFDLDD
ncbi:hypothetical protein NP233_g1107 [Leucocoprinus birnbaumii]|uniref:DUF6532 domain-containing protein n=1 Tax=Leucocoprinus birnbaumii TaxID=56174 RepID=A0AAD5W0Z8_9AGAR|nr:hypothetical protein NP233_g1107 [Leucocoprinus birnbaumii]